MNRFLLTIVLIALFGCSKSNEHIDDMKRQLSVNIMAVRVTTPYVSNNWEVLLTMDKAVTLMEGNIIV